MDYAEVNIPVAGREQAEILVALLSDFPVESFAERPGLLSAYLPADALADCKESIDALLAGRGIAAPRYVLIEERDWNEEWERGFTQVEIEGGLVVRAPFHPARPDAVLEVVITPRMAFGTGHHATTALVGAALMRLDLRGLTGLDMGCGTGVLAIVAALRGARSVDALDLDRWAYENCIENLAANGVADRVHPMLGDASAVEGRTYDFIASNINRNTLLADLPRYERMLVPGGRALLSGFLEADLPSLRACAASLGLESEREELQQGWAMLCVRKPAKG